MPLAPRSGATVSDGALEVTFGAFGDSMPAVGERLRVSGLRHAGVVGLPGLVGADEARSANGEYVVASLDHERQVVVLRRPPA